MNSHLLRLEATRTMAKDKKPKKGKDEDEDIESEDGDGDGEANGDGEGEGGKKKLPLKLMLMIGVPALVLLIGGGAAAFFLLKPKPDAEAEAGKEKDKKDKDKKKEKDKKGKGKDAKGKDEKGGPVIKEGPDGVMFYTLPDILVNIQSNDGRPTYLKLRLTLEAPSQDTLDIMEPLMPRVTDMFTSFLRELRTDDLTGSEGSMRLRLELLRRVNLALAPQAKVNAVLIEEMLVQ